MQRVVAAREPRRHRGDLLIAIRLQHAPRVAVRTDRGLDLLLVRTEVTPGLGSTKSPMRRG